jgi:hypothetical protein
MGELPDLRHECATPHVGGARDRLRWCHVYRRGRAVQRVFKRLAECRLVRPHEGTSNDQHAAPVELFYNNNSCHPVRGHRRTCSPNCNNYHKYYSSTGPTSAVQGNQGNLFEIICHLEERPGAAFDAQGARLALPATWKHHSGLILWRMLDNTLCNATVDSVKAPVALHVNGQSVTFCNVDFASESRSIRTSRAKLNPRPCHMRLTNCALHQSKF